MKNNTNMKGWKRLVCCVSALSMVMAGAAVAHANYGMAGCGLGSQFFESNTTGSQLTAATTNGTSGNQTFGITSGTSNCVSGGTVKADREQEAFVEANYESLQRDLANGDGEYLFAFAGLLGCSEEATPALGSFAQANFEKIAGPDASPLGMLYTVKTGISIHPVLSNQCTRI